MDEELILDRERIAQELEIVRSLSSDGLLHPTAAVQWARNNTESALYKNLDWDDTSAAEKYRIDQIRGLVRVVVTTSAETGKPIRAYISQPSDRLHGGGYSKVGDALARARSELVNEALAKLRRLRTQFSHLPELSAIFDKIEKEADEFQAGRLKLSA